MRNVKELIKSRIFPWLLSTIMGIALITEIRGCKSTVKLEDIPPSKETIRYVPQKPQIKNNMVPYPVEVTRIDTFVAEVDTTAILSEYFAKKRYKDTILFDGAKVSIEELVSENKIQWRNVRLDMDQKEITIERNFYEVPRNKVYLGSSVFISRKSIANSFTIDGVFIPKSDRMMLQAGYDILNQQVRIGAAFKLSIRKGKDFKAIPITQ